MLGREPMTSSSPMATGYEMSADSHKAKGNFVDIGDIVDGKKQPGALVDVFGCVTRIRLPIKTRGIDFKMAVYLTDKSLEDTGDTICLNIFLPDEDNMPKFNLADVVLVKSSKVQKPRGDLGYSLLYSYNTRIHIFRAQRSSPAALDYVPWAARPKYPRLNGSISGPSPLETTFALYLHKSINKGALPDITTFKQDATRSLNIQDKRRELKDVCAFSFCDLLVQVVSDPYFTDFPCAMFWVSDYTENDAFECHGSPMDGNGGHHEVGDASGHLTKFGRQVQHQQNSQNLASWSGPRGKRSMLVVCYTPHSEFVQANVKRNSWITMKNVQIRQGQCNLEGVLREDPGQGSPLRVSMVETTGIKLKDMDLRFVAALRRKKEYEKGRKAETKKRKEIHDNKADEGKPLNAKRRRAHNRREGKKEQSSKNDQPKDYANGQTKDQAKNGSTDAVLSLVNQPNDAICSEFRDRAVTPLSCVLEPSLYDGIGAGATGADLRLPFANIKLKAQVRVVDFLPNSLLDFAVSRRANQYEVLGDEKDGDGNDSGSSLSSEDDSDGEGELVWQWRFALLLEDASTPASNNGDGGPPPPRIWAVVDNYDGQTLTRQDACNLRNDLGALATLRERMFLMWGNLEEIKSNAERRRLAEKEAAEAAELAARAAERKRIREEEARRAVEDKKRRERERMAVNGTDLSKYPPPGGEEDGDDDNDDQCEPPNAQTPACPEVPKQQQQATASKKPAEPLPKPINRPFVCCLRQYGVWETTADNDENNDDDGNEEESADGDRDEESGPKQAWQQMFGMFGTVIKG